MRHNNNTKHNLTQAVVGFVTVVIGALMLVAAFILGAILL